MNDGISEASSPGRNVKGETLVHQESRSLDFFSLILNPVASPSRDCQGAYASCRLIKHDRPYDAAIITTTLPSSSLSLYTQTCANLKYMATTTEDATTSSNCMILARSTSATRQIATTAKHMDIQRGIVRVPGTRSTGRG